MQQRNTNSVFRYVDWFTVVLYVILVIGGVISIYAASYDFDHASILDSAEFSGKQIRWVGLAFATGLILMLIDPRIYEIYAYPIYIVMLFVLLITIFIAPDIKGSHSWLKIGSMSLQPAEFAKVATSLALARLFNTYGFQLTASRRNFITALVIIFVPILLILGQSETGSALAYLSLFLVLYREGMSGLVLLAAVCAVLFFVVAVKYTTTTMLGIPTGQAAVFIMIMVMMVGMLASFCKRPDVARNCALWFIATGALAGLLTLCGVAVPGYLFFLSVLTVAVGYAVFMSLNSGFGAGRMWITSGAVVASIIFLFSINYTFEHILRPHQQQRILVTLGTKEEPRGAGYNVNQSKIAIGSGGFAGKGFLNGTQTKLKYVPEQHTDFIYCTIGEEEGFIGSATVLLLFLALILRVMTLAERQPTVFGRVYAYCVASFFIFHLAINVGMVIGLCPVIGIPLPFFSYGGSSLWGFTFLLFILLSIDARRRGNVDY